MVYSSTEILLFLESIYRGVPQVIKSGVVLTIMWYNYTTLSSNTAKILFLFIDAKLIDAWL